MQIRFATPDFVSMLQVIIQAKCPPFVADLQTIIVEEKVQSWGSIFSHLVFPVILVLHMIHKGALRVPRVLLVVEITLYRQDERVLPSVHFF